MIVGIGADVVNIERFRGLLERTPGLRERLFSPEESEGLTLRSLAARFAAKEAVAKALGAPGGLRWHDCRVVGGRGSAPRIELSGTVLAAARAKGIRKWHLSLTHDEPVALAYVIAEA